MTNNGNDVNGDDINGYDGKTDHQVIIELEKETAQQANQISELTNRLNQTQSDNEQLMKLAGQISIIKVVFAGCVFILSSTLLLSAASWFVAPEHSESVEKTVSSTLSLAERALLVLIGVLSSLASGLYGQRGQGYNGS
tara:strand:+ start:561 stop:977 length:417 start_codon:yes stop_codon:yes gene_type:complete